MSPLSWPGPRLSLRASLPEPLARSGLVWRHGQPPASSGPGFLLFPRLTQLDFTGPYEVLAHLPELEIYTIAEEAGPW